MALTRPIQGINGYLYVLEKVFSPEECTAILQVAETHGFETAGFYNDPEGKPVVVESIRKSQRVMLDMPELATTLFERVKYALPHKLNNGLTLCGLNERMRILKYLPGDEFKRHTDGNYMTPDAKQISQITLLLYLNEGYDGAHTTYYNQGDTVGVAVHPTVGSVVLMDQRLIHEVPPLRSGVKYALRTDVMYG
jgi:predicted 2-oxoglutarate/Fe(II)-dependent dioxygenase YbiX